PHPGFADRAFAALLVGFAVVVLGHRLLFEPNPVVEELTSGAPRREAILSNVDEALLAEGTPSRWQTFATVVCLVTVVALVVIGRRLTGRRKVRRREASQAPEAARALPFGRSPGWSAAVGLMCASVVVA